MGLDGSLICWSKRLLSAFSSHSLSALCLYRSFCLTVYAHAHQFEQSLSVPDIMNIYVQVASDWQLGYELHNQLTQGASSAPGHCWGTPWARKQNCYMFRAAHRLWHLFIHQCVFVRKTFWLLTSSEIQQLGQWPQASNYDTLPTHGTVYGKGHGKVKQQHVICNTQ